MSKKFLKKKQMIRRAQRDPSPPVQKVDAAQEALAPPEQIAGIQAPQARTRRAHANWSKLDLSTLSVDGGTQSRVEFNVEALEDYADRMIEEPMSGLVLDQDGEPWPALVVFDDGTNRWLADGFHRMRAARRAGLTHFQADIKHGELRDAIRLSLGVNAKHGLRRSNEDKRLAITRALQDDEWVRYSDRKVAELCAVSAPTVARVRRELEGVGDIEVAHERIGSDGRLQDTSTRTGAHEASLSNTAARQTSSPDNALQKLNSTSLGQSDHLASLLETTPIKASSLDSLDRKDRRELVFVTSDERTDLQAVCDHLDTLMGRQRGGVVVMPVPDDSTALLELLARLDRRKGRARVVALEKAQGLVIVYQEDKTGASNAKNAPRPELLPHWIRGLGDVLSWCEAKSFHVIGSSRN